MGAWLLIAWFLALAPPHGEDPLLRMPSGARYQNVSDWNRQLSAALETESNAVIYRSPEFREEIRQKVQGTLPYGELFFLEAWGASGDPQAVSALMRLYDKIQEPMWAYVILSGLARSMDPAAHRFVLEKLPGIDMSQMPVRPPRADPTRIVLFLALRDPQAAAGLLDDPRTASWAADSLLKMPSPQQFSHWMNAARQQRVAVSLFLAYLAKTFASLPAQEQQSACDFVWSQPPASINENSLWPVLASCPAAGRSPRWAALLGKDAFMLGMLKGMRDQPWLQFPPDAFYFLNALLQEFSSQTSWERLLLEVLGQVSSPQAVRVVASYVLHENLALREQALSSLSLGAHPSAARMLHAASLETAGEEAIAYFLPYLHHTRDLSAHDSQRRLLVEVARRYLHVRETPYAHAALQVLAWAPGVSPSEWWRTAEAIARDCTARKDWKTLAGLLPILARAPQGEAWIQKALLHPDTNLGLAAAAALALTPNTRFVPILSEMAQSPQKSLAINAAYALSRTTLDGNFAALQSVWWEAKTHAVHGLAAFTPDPRACTALLEELDFPQTTVAIIQTAVSVLMQRCPRMQKSVLRKLALLPAHLLEQAAGRAFLKPAPPAPFFLRLVNSQHIPVAGKKFQATLGGTRSFMGFTGLAGVVFWPSVARESVRLDWLD